MLVGGEDGETELEREGGEGERAGKERDGEVLRWEVSWVCFRFCPE
jgi:hypothetical protein